MSVSVSSPQPEPNPRNAPNECRLFVRAHPGSGLTCTLNLGDDQKRCPAEVANVSRGGVGLVVRTYLEPGASILLLFTNASQLFSARETAVVCYTLGRPDGTYLTGCEFSHPLTVEQFQLLLS